MTELPPLPETKWLLHMPARPYEPEWTSSQQGYDESQMREYAEAYAAAAVAKERERCAKLCDVIATQHSVNNRVSARWAAEDCAAAIRATQATPQPRAASGATSSGAGKLGTPQP